jgi:hypothetical protein
LRSSRNLDRSTVVCHNAHKLGYCGLGGIGRPLSIGGGGDSRSLHPFGVSFVAED